MAALPSLPRALGALAAAVALGGCGAGGEQTGRTDTVGGREPVEVVGGEYFFDPETVVVESSTVPLAIVFRNEGSLAHNLKVFRDDEEVAGTATFQGGEAERIEADLAPGDYRMVCTVGDHAELGMVGDIEVR